MTWATLGSPLTSALSTDEEYTMTMLMAHCINPAPSHGGA